jgi:hypothetical protein
VQTLYVVDDDLKIEDPPEVMLVNSDDDNENGIVDFDDYDPTQGEDDLYPIQLSFPDITASDQSLNLTIMQGWVRIWEHADRSGWHIDSGLINGKTFTSSSVDQLEHTVYVEAHSASALMGDVMLLIGAGQVGSPGPANATTRGATNVGITAAVVPNSNVLVGQRMSFSVSGPPQAVANCSWTNSGNAVAGYTTTLQNGKVTPWDRTNSQFQLYWIDGAFAGQDLTVTGTIQGLIPQARTFHYKVFKPLTGQVVSTINGPMNTGLGAQRTTAVPPFTRFARPNGSIAVCFGDPTGIDGVTFLGSTKTPASGGGELGLVQRTNFEIVYTLPIPPGQLGPPTIKLHTSHNEFVLDARQGQATHLYNDINPTALAAGEWGIIPAGTGDSPGTNEDATYASIRITAFFEDFLVFNPDRQGNGIWVTLCKNTWNVSFTIVPVPGGGPWNIINPSDHVNQTGANSTELPTWSTFSNAILAAPPQ